jgi:O-antigen ligase
VPLAVVLTWSRGIWVGLVIGLAVVLLLGRNLLYRRRTHALFAFTSFSAVALIGVATTSLSESLEQKIGNTSTVYGRVATWRLAVETGLSSPILGTGMNNMRVVLAKEGAEYAGKHSFPRVHNSFLQIFAEQGALGLFLFLAMIASILRLGMKIRSRAIYPREKWRGVAVLAVMLAYLTPAMFASTIHVPVAFVHSLVYVVIGAIAGRYRVSLHPAKTCHLDSPANRNRFTTTRLNYSL